jgi:HK97 family phage major capsid protein
LLNSYVFVTDAATQNPAETADVDPPPSDATVGRYQFIARPYALEEKMSWEVLEDSAIDLAAAVQTNMARRLAVSIQSDFIYGSGAQTIQGFTGAAGLLTVVEGGGANGLAPASSTGYNYVAQAIQKCESAKTVPDLMVTSPLAAHTYGNLKNTLNDALTPQESVRQFLEGRNGKRFRTTTAVKDDETVGTATADCSDLFVMNSDFVYWAIRHDFSVMPLRERFATQRLLGVLAWQRLDATLVHAEAACWLQGIKTS